MELCLCQSLPAMSFALLRSPGISKCTLQFFVRPDGLTAELLPPSAYFTSYLYHSPIIISLITYRSSFARAPLDKIIPPDLNLPNSGSNLGDSMDAQDVSMEAELQVVLGRQKRALEEAKKRRGQCPSNRKPLHQLVGEYMLAYLGRQISERAPHSLRRSFVPPPYLPCIEPLKTLKKVYIRDLGLETHHRGRYIMLRSVTPPTKFTGVMMIASDENGDGITLQLYHQQDEQSGPIKDPIQVNNVYIIKEPYFKTMSDGRHGVRVDHVSDISRLPNDDEEMPLKWRPCLVEKGKTAMKWKEEGNALLRQQDLGGAVSRYVPSHRVLRLRI